MDLFADQEKKDEFLRVIGALLHKMDIYLDTIHSDDLSRTVARKRMELVDSLKLMKSYFRANRYPQEISRPMRHTSDSNNNNNSKDALSQSTEDEQRKHSLRPCLCQDLTSLCIIPRTLDVSSARQSHFSRSLLDRMRSSDDQCLLVYAEEILIIDYRGWLSVDDEHMYYAVIADCLLCLFEKEDSAFSSMTVNLNGTHSQPTESSHYQNSLTISTQEEVLYFYASSAQCQKDWVKWLNVGAQLPFEALLLQARPPESSRNNTQTGESPLESCHLEPVNENLSQCADSLDQTDGGEEVKMRKDAAVLRQPTRVHHRSQSVFVDNETVRRRISKSASLRPSSSYDSTPDLGMSRRFPSTKELMQELGLKRSSLLNNGQAPDRQKSSLQADTSRPQYFENQVLKNSLSKSTTLVGKGQPSWRTKLVRRASTLFMTKSGKFSLPKRANSENFSNSLDQPKWETEEKILRTASQDKGLDLPVDMAELCEVQGYLLLKKPLKWVSYYCCVYNGTFSCFKDQRSSFPEIQCHLSECQVIPVVMKRPFVFKLVSNSKSSCFAAVSDADLHAWYNIFNNYIKGALDLPMVEKTSADGASRHSDESDSLRDMDPKRDMSGLNMDNNADKQGKLRKVSFEKRGTKPAPPRRSATSQAVIMRSASESDDKPYKYARRMMPKKSLSQFYCRSVDDIPGIGSSNSSSGDEEVSIEETRIRPRRTHEDRKKSLLEKMMKEKLRIEQALQQQKRREDEEAEMEVLVNMTQLQQRRVSTQLKYDFLERKLNDKKEDKSRYSGLFQKSTKVEKAGKPLQVTAADSVDSNQHIRQQMEELKHKLDSLDKGLTETRSKHTTSMNKILKNSPGLTSSALPPSPSDSLSQHKLRGLESIIETLEAPNHQLLTSSSLPQYSTNCTRCLTSSANQDTAPPLEIRAETMAVINEFETMTRNLLSTHSLVDDDDS